MEPPLAAASPILLFVSSFSVILWMDSGVLAPVYRHLSGLFGVGMLQVLPASVLPGQQADGEADIFESRCVHRGPLLLGGLLYRLFNQMRIRRGVAMLRKNVCLVAMVVVVVVLVFFFQAEDGIRDYKVTGVQTCALPISFALPCALPSCSRKSSYGLARN